MAREIRVIEKATGEVVETIDVSGESERSVSQTLQGLRLQMNRDEYRTETI